MLPGDQGYNECWKFYFRSFLKMKKALSLPNLYSGTMQKMKQILLLMLLATASILPVQAQKIGFANLELILAFMPEAQAVDRELQSYNEQLSQALQAKQAYLQTKVAEFEEEISTAGESLSEARMQEMQSEIRKLQQELQKSQASSEQKLMIRRQDKLTPILDKIQRSIDAYAEEHAFTYILNSTSGGTSIVLHAGEQYNITKDLMIKLGIEIPEDLEE